MAEILVADGSKFQCRFLGDPNNIFDQYDPTKWVVDWDWEALRNSGIQGFIVRLGIRLKKDPCYDRIVAGLKRIRMPWGVYHVFDQRYTPRGQAGFVRACCPELPPLGVTADIELGNILFYSVDDYLRELDENFHDLTRIYSGGPYMNTHFTRQQQRAWLTRKVEWAGYPNFILPSGWVGVLPAYHLHQFSSSFHLAGIPRPIDMARVNPNVPFESLLTTAPVVSPQPLYTAEVLYNVNLRDGSGALIPGPNGLTFIAKGEIVDVWEEFNISSALPNRALIYQAPNRPNIVRVTTASGPSLKRLS